MYSHRSFDRVSRAKLQNPQLALQALVKANSQRPGPAEETTSRSVSHARSRALHPGLETAPVSGTVSVNAIWGPSPDSFAGRFESCIYRAVEGTQNMLLSPA